jgi:hypothetical protein
MCVVEGGGEVGRLFLVPGRRPTRRSISQQRLKTSQVARWLIFQPNKEIKSVENYSRKKLNIIKL